MVASAKWAVGGLGPTGPAAALRRLNGFPNFVGNVFAGTPLILSVRTLRQLSPNPIIPIMKTWYLKSATVVLVCSRMLGAELVIPSDGSDGALNILTNTVIDLAAASTNLWNAPNGEREGTGVYDAEKWAVVFKYDSVYIDAGATVTFKNHPSRAPVVWLVKGDVTIHGIVSLNGQDSVPVPRLAEPGPGGFRGGSGYFGSDSRAGAGFGPGGGGRRVSNVWGAGGSYGSLGPGGSVTYGNPSLIPLVGGSGGSGHDDVSARASGAGGGGAILIACSGRMLVSGQVRADGGAKPPGVYATAGSGGGVRLVAGDLAVTGAVRALSGPTDGNGNPGGYGRIRIERVIGTISQQITPDADVVTLPEGSTPQIWMPEDGPEVKILSIGGQSVTEIDPRAEFGMRPADVVLPQVDAITVRLQTVRVHTNSTVIVRVTPRANGNFLTRTAVVDRVEIPDVVEWSANLPVNDGYSAIQVRVVRP